jgi:hypothetical protein
MPNLGAYGIKVLQNVSLAWGKILILSRSDNIEHQIENFIFRRVDSTESPDPLRSIHCTIRRDGVTCCMDSHQCSPNHPVSLRYEHRSISRWIGHSFRIGSLLTDPLCLGNRLTGVTIWLKVILTRGFPKSRTRLRQLIQMVSFLFLDESRLAREETKLNHQTDMGAVDFDKNSTGSIPRGWERSYDWQNQNRP